MASEKSARVTLRDILNQAQWHHADLSSCTLEIVHRGAPGDRRVLSGGAIASVLAAGVRLEEGTVIPYHRAIRLRGADGSVRWEREPATNVVESEAVVAPTAQWSPVATPEVRLEDGAELVFDGRAGEGGGQIVRTALTMSLLTGRAFRIENVRGGRSKPGLLRQHMTCVRAACEVSASRAEGSELRSNRLRFVPGPVRSGDYAFEVGTAGSAVLVAQSVLLPLLLTEGESTLSVSGGTHARSAPTADGFQRAFLSLLRAQGADVEMQLARYGFYPAGGGRLELRLGACAMVPFDLQRTVRGPLRVEALTSHLPRHVAQRELDVFEAQLEAELPRHAPLELATHSVRSPGPGNALMAFAQGARHTNVFSAFGERRVRAEEVAHACVDAYLRFHREGGAVDEHLADQLMLPLALVGGAYTCGVPTLHTLTNASVIGAFTGHAPIVERCGAGPLHRVRVSPDAAAVGRARVALS